MRKIKVSIIAISFADNCFDFNSCVGGGFIIRDYTSSFNTDNYKEWKLIAYRKYTHSMVE